MKRINNSVVEKVNDKMTLARDREPEQSLDVVAGLPSGESTCLPPMWPGFGFHTRCHMWIEFVGPLLCHERFFPGYSSSPPSSKTSI